MKKALSKLGPLTLPAAFAAFLLILFFFSRVLNYLLFRGKISATIDVFKVFFIGARVDLASACMAALLLLFVFLCLPRRWVTRLRYVVAAYVTLVLGASLFLEAATPSFIHEFGLRPNQLILEHVFDFKEIFQTIIANHLFELIATLAVLAAVSRAAFRFSLRAVDGYQPWPLKRLLWAAPLILLLVILGARGKGLKGRPMGLAVAEFSNVSLANQLALNSAYSFGHALAQLHDEVSPQDVYRFEMSDAEVLARVKARSTVAAGDFIGDENNPLLHRQRPSLKRKRPMNFVILLEESLGAEYVGSLGGPPLTPNLDRLGKTGLNFTRLYSTGTRSARGIEAVISGFLPTPGESIIKLGKSQVDFFTIAGLLKKNGYHTSFVYGGDANFDNMKTWSNNNGFEEIIDQTDMKSPVYQGIWGVSDEDTMKKADEHFRAQGERPFFSLVFTVSNHGPFEFPDGRIKLYKKPKATVHNAIKYADYSLGMFFELAKKSPYYKDTVFLVVADHNWRNFGSDLVPVAKMRIPGMILGPGIVPLRYDKPVSQVDLVPTALSLLGIATHHPMIGHDILARPKDHPGRAIMQFGQSNAYMLGDHVVILQPRRSVKQFLFKNGSLSPAAAADPDLVQDAIAHAYLPGWLYHSRKYH